MFDVSFFHLMFPLDVPDVDVERIPGKCEDDHLLGAIVKAMHDEAHYFQVITHTHRFLSYYYQTKPQYLYCKVNTTLFPFYSLNDWTNGICFNHIYGAIMPEQPLPMHIAAFTEIS